MKHDQSSLPLPKSHGSGCRPAGLQSGAPQLQQGFWVDLPAESAVSSPEISRGAARPESLPEEQPHAPTAPREVFGGENFPTAQNGRTAFFPGYPLNPGQLNPLYDSAAAKASDNKPHASRGMGTSANSSAGVGMSRSAGTSANSSAGMHHGVDMSTDSSASDDSSTNSSSGTGANAGADTNRVAGSGAGAAHIGRGFSAQYDPEGSWTGVPISPQTTPVQDADDL